MKTKIAIFLLIFVIVALLSGKFASSQTDWSQLPSPSSTDHLYGIYFKDVSTGVTGSYRTSDGGQIWSTFNYSGYAMTFVNQSTGYIVPGIYKTTNSGVNWIQQTSPTANALYSVYFANVNTGYACGNNTKVIKTTNGGNNWELLTVSTSGYILEGIYFTDVSNGYILGHEFSNHSCILLRTTNGGSSFSIQYFPSGTHYYAIWFINGNIGVAIGEKIIKTTDAGSNWIEKPYSNSLFQQSIYFPSSNVGYSAGWSGRIVKTTDGGETWFQQTTGTGSDLESVYFLNDNTGFVCGDNGVVLKTTDGGGPPIGIKPISNEVPDNFSLYQNYPNPFNPVTKIKFDVTAPLTAPEGGKQANVILKIFDARGREIAVLVNFALSPGSYEVTWEASNYPSGVYFYTLTTNSYKETKRMVLLK